MTDIITGSGDYVTVDGPWIEPPKPYPAVGETWVGLAAGEEVKIEAVAASHVIFSKDPNYSASTHVEAFQRSYAPKPKTVTRWVNVWWNATKQLTSISSIPHKTEDLAKRSANGQQSSSYILLTTIEVEIPNA